MKTLNEKYNEVLKSWKEKYTCEILPECENCGCDLTGQEVIETDINWVCTECFENDEDDYYIMSDWEERQHERRQRGIE